MEKLFSIMIILSSWLVCLSRNPVHSVLSLILLFVNGSGMLLLLGFEFLSLVLLVVYVGAIAVLFLFIVMMMDLKGVNLRSSLLSYYPLGIIMAIMSLIEMKTYLVNPFVWYDLSGLYVDWSEKLFEDSNLSHLGEVLYTYYYLAFLVSSYILLVGMVGAIYLTYEKKGLIKKQEIFEQISRSKKYSLKYWK